MNPFSKTPCGWSPWRRPASLRAQPPSPHFRQTPEGTAGKVRSLLRGPHGRVGGGSGGRGGGGAQRAPSCLRRSLSPGFGRGSRHSHQVHSKALLLCAPSPPQKWLARCLLPTVCLLAPEGSCFLISNVHELPSHWEATPTKFMFMEGLSLVTLRRWAQLCLCSGHP